MQLQPMTNHSIRIVLELAKKDKMNIHELSSALQLDAQYVSRILNKLKSTYIVDATQGVTGGYSLKADTREITPLRIAEIMEPTMKINRCMEEDGYCSRHGTATCVVRPIYQEIQGIIEKELSRYTIYDLINYTGENEVKI